MSDILLQIKNLNFSYGDIPLLKDVNIELKKGQFMLINGASGLGKSTLLRLISRLEVVNSEANLIFMGQDYSHYSEKKLEKLRYQMPLMGQDRLASYSVNRSTMASVIELACLRKIDNKINLEKNAKKMAIELGLNNEIWYKHVKQLSGGELARLTFIRFFLLQSSLYLIDEGESGLDEANLAKLIKLVNDKLASGISFIWVSHRNSFITNNSVIKKIIKDNCLVVLDN